MQGTEIHAFGMRLNAARRYLAEIDGGDDNRMGLAALALRDEERRVRRVASWLPAASRRRYVLAYMAFATGVLAELDEAEAQEFAREAADEDAALAREDARESWARAERARRDLAVLDVRARTPRVAPRRPERSRRDAQPRSAHSSPRKAHAPPSSDSDDDPGGEGDPSDIAGKRLARLAVADYVWAVCEDQRDLRDRVDAHERLLEELISDVAWLLAEIRCARGEGRL